MHISVIIPVYNRESTLARAVRSALDQEPEPEEIIIVDDGSTDGSARVAEALAEVSPKVRVIRQRNQGAARARNTGIKHASGDWIAFLDSDDEWAPGRIQRIASFVTANPALDFVHGNRVVLREDGSVDEIQQRVESSSQGSDREYLLAHMRIKTSTVLVRRDLLDRAHGLFNERLRTCEDYELFWRLVLMANAIAYDVAEGVIIHDTASSLTKQQRKSQLRDHVLARQLVADWGKEQKLNESTHAALTHHLKHEIYAALRHSLEAGVLPFIKETIWLTGAAGSGVTSLTLARVARKRLRRSWRSPRPKP